MKTLRLSSDLEDKIRVHCVDCYPREACGLLIGGDNNIVTDIVPSPNLSNQPQKNFEIDPALIIGCQKKTRRGGQKILGHYHSHPDGRAAPSRYDQNHNYDPELVWLIIPVTDTGAADMKAFFTDSQSGQLAAILLDQPGSAGTA